MQEFKLERSCWRFYWFFHILKKSGSATYHSKQQRLLPAKPKAKLLIPESITWREHEPYDVVQQADFVITMTEAQALMDSLWDCGLRPTEGSGSAGAFTAQGAHLSDLRKLVFSSGKFGVKDE